MLFDIFDTVHKVILPHATTYKEISFGVCCWREVCEVATETMLGLNTTAATHFRCILLNLVGPMQIVLMCLVGGVHCGVYDALTVGVSRDVQMCT